MKISKLSYWCVLAVSTAILATACESIPMSSPGLGTGDGPGEPEVSEADAAAEAPPPPAQATEEPPPDEAATVSLAASEEFGIIQDHFDSPRLDTGTWALELEREQCRVTMEDGRVVFSNDINEDEFYTCKLNAVYHPLYEELGHFEGQFYATGDATGRYAAEYLEFYTALDDGWWSVSCGMRWADDPAEYRLFMQVTETNDMRFYSQRDASAQEWYEMRLEVDHNSNTIRCYGNDELVGEYTLPTPDYLQDQEFSVIVINWRDPNTQATFWLDDVRIIGVNSLIQVAGNSTAGYRFDAPQSGLYTFAYLRGSYSTFREDEIPSGVDTWRTELGIFKNEAPQWNGDQFGETVYARFPDTDIHSSAEEAESQAQGQSITVPLAEGDYLIIVARDDVESYPDNPGEVILSVEYSPSDPSQSATPVDSAPQAAISRCDSGVTLYLDVVNRQPAGQSTILYESAIRLADPFFGNVSYVKVPNGCKAVLHDASDEANLSLWIGNTETLGPGSYILPELQRGDTGTSWSDSLAAIEIYSN